MGEAKTGAGIGARSLFLIVAALFAFVAPTHAQDNNYEIGAGIADITGEIVDIPYFGYAKPRLKSRGLRDRQYARAFIVQEPGGKPVVFVSIDKGAMFPSVNRAVIAKLRERFGELYTDDNVVISATHTHVAAGGQSHYSLYKRTTDGFYKTTFDVEVKGIVTSIERAHATLAPGRIYFSRGALKNASIQRSMPAFLANPEATEQPSIDEDMTVLKFIQGNGKEIGLIAWFAVHPVSLPYTWELSSADNKGYAATRFETLKGSSYGASGSFVAAFAQSNAGDMSPRLHLHSPDGTLNTSAGSKETPEENLTTIGERQFQSALALYDSASMQLTGSVSFVSRYDDVSKIAVDKTFTDGQSSQTTCPPAFGMSFAAGAEEHRAGWLIWEGMTRDSDSGSGLDRCHAEKWIVPFILKLSSDPDNPSVPAVPTTVPTTLLKIGQLGILAAPAEFTITSGRRARAIVEEIDGTGITETVFAGYADAYTGYVATREEYAIQQYEGASTLFGPWTHAAYLQQFSRLARKLAYPESDPWSEAEPTAPILPEPEDTTVQIVRDTAPSGKVFGSVHTDAGGSYAPGEEVRVIFWGAHPNNKLNTEGSYLQVQRETGEGAWVDIALDRDQTTKLEWKRYGQSASLITVIWAIPGNAESGQYRVRHNGASKDMSGELTDYAGYSRTFSVRDVKQ